MVAKYEVSNQPFDALNSTGKTLSGTQYSGVPLSDVAFNATGMTNAQRTAALLKSADSFKSNRDTSPYGGSVGGHSSYSSYAAGNNTSGYSGGSTRTNSTNEPMQYPLLSSRPASGSKSKGVPVSSSTNAQVYWAKSTLPEDDEADNYEQQRDRPPSGTGADYRKPPVDDGYMDPSKLGRRSADEPPPLPTLPHPEEAYEPEYVEPMSMGAAAAKRAESERVRAPQKAVPQQPRFSEQPTSKARAAEAKGQAEYINMSSFPERNPLAAPPPPYPAGGKSTTAAAEKFNWPTTASRAAPAASASTGRDADYLNITTPSNARAPVPPPVAPRVPFAAAPQAPAGHQLQSAPPPPPMAAHSAARPIGPPPTAMRAPAPPTATQAFARPGVAVSRPRLV